MLGAVGSGFFPDIHPAVDAMVTIDHTIDPDEKTAALYQDLFGIFREAYESNARSGVYRSIYEFQQRYF